MGVHTSESWHLGTELDYLGLRVIYLFVDRIGRTRTFALWARCQSPQNIAATRLLGTHIQVFETQPLIPHHRTVSRRMAA